MDTLSYILEWCTSTFDDIVAQIKVIWPQLKGSFVVPFLTISLYICLVMSIMLFTEIVYMALVVGYIRLFKKTPEKRYKFELFKDDTESGNSAYPLVLVQLPMFNEKEVYRLSIRAACELSWPSNRIVIQVLDDSTDPSIKELVRMECQEWASKGKNIHYQVRDNREGYKAGALNKGLKHSYANECEYVAIFDADFQPEPDFLLQTIPYLHHNPQLGLVQARWKFVNSNECLMTRMQEMTLDYHFNVEQESGSSTYAFFGFNGTAGVWRMATLDEAGGWQGRTTVEDMDLAIRATLKGWKFLYLASVKVKNELPSTFKAYRYQQHRWACGPAKLFKKVFMEILRSKNVTLWKKLYMIYSFFFIRKLVAHIVTFMLYCVVLPTAVLVPEVVIPNWGVFYIPLVITLLHAFGTPRSFHLVFIWILFENVMSLHRTKATFIGLFETNRANEWVVTEKHGDALKEASEPLLSPRLKIGERLLILELCVGVLLFISASLDFAIGTNHHYIYLYLQATAFLIMGSGNVGTHPPNS
ncbi:glucomannan 4-beta-mannosyltransferase 9-like protein [Tanacetum coccineum]